jgi:2'-hydroxyisoflavone reductase
MTTRREVLQLAAAGAALPLEAALATTRPKPGTMLIFGGTGFIGPHLTEEALRHGWKVTHFNRGKKAAGGVSGVETLIGDRKGQLDALQGRKWDVVVDDTGYIPKYVKMSADLLAPNVGYCLYISSISAYASFAKPNDEHSPTGKLSDPNVEEITGETYGPVRASKGGEMLAPGTPNDPVQIIDVRDLVVWMMKLVDSRTTGYFNANSPPSAFTMGELIKASQQASPKADTKATWVSEEFLASRWKPEELDLPPWSPMKGDSAGASLTAIKPAIRTGLRSRPLAETVRDTLAWFHSLPAERQAKLKAGLDPQKETDTLRAWHESNSKS